MASFLTSGESAPAAPHAAQGTLKDRQSALTRRILLDAAVAQLQEGPWAELTIRAVARRAGVAERTAFRHLCSREEFLDALSIEVSLRLELPELPKSAADLPSVPRALYRAYDAHATLTRAALHSELFDRIRETTAQEPWLAVRRLVDAFAPGRTEGERALTAANIRYLLSATSWNYYRTYFGLNLKDSVAAAEQAITLLVNSLVDSPLGA
ncbi:TetR/AcrR family transcriptional regulator [Ramlibacter algicola]|uniref:TetR/AcrR family transcriptional regulator n=1 Tax=Ramlibacter algicola TaxID=2795217 RepID=A0A934Q1S9_9BURK|nr:TetR/AcrR family transcriptional regulator [Ramlibacter algicola]MBK0392697.1 TetR/AcrR family transcriptional regulator [Ramlibacter algicola]